MKNIFRGIITTIFGTIILGITTFFIFKGIINFKGEGAVGIGLGILLLFVPDNIIQIVADILKAKYTKKENQDV